MNSGPYFVLLEEEEQDITSESGENGKGNQGTEKKEKHKDKKEKEMKEKEKKEEKKKEEKLKEEKEDIHLFKELWSVLLEQVEEDLTVRVRGEHNVRVHSLKITTQL